ncbi:MAG: hypothetical protein SGILL_008635 [Bacillariaceae sp.]
MTANEQSKLDDFSFEPPAVVAEAIDARGKETTASSTSSKTSSVSTQDTEVEGERIDITKDVPEGQKHLVGPAGVGGAVVGFVLGGPVGSAVLGFGSAYAVRKENKAGEAARALGELSLSVKTKASEIEDRHRYVERSVTAVNSTCEKSKCTLVHKTKKALVDSWTTLEKCTKRKQLLERGVEGTGRGFEYVASVVTGSGKKKTKQASETESEELLFEDKSQEVKNLVSATNE